jgi:hypothetical protein
MAKITNTFLSSERIGNREDLSDLISNIAPEDTPITDAIGTRMVANTAWSWQNDTLASADTANAQPEGNDITSFPAIVPTVRITSNVQISSKQIIVSDTLEKVDAAGRKSEIAYQSALRAMELKIDVEAIAFGTNQATSGTDPRTTGSILAFLKSNDDFGVGGASPVWTTTPSATRTDGTPRALTETMLKTVVASAWSNGAKPRMICVGAVNKQLISTSFVGRATTTVNADKMSPTFVQGAADVYVSDFGNLRIVACRNIRARDLFVLDPSKLRLVYLRPYARKKLAKTGDAEKMYMVAEWGLQCDNEKAHGLVADLS